MRENTASSGRHAPRLTRVISSNTNHLEQQSPETQSLSTYEELPATSIESSLHAGAENVATGGETACECCLLTVHEVAALLHVPVSWVYGRMRKRSTERLPGYRLGKYWRFRKHQILEWVERHRGGHHAA
jgi:excisionase family DNA binding protein